MSGADKAELRAYRKANGLCWECGARCRLHTFKRPRSTRRLSRCKFHLEDQRARSEARRAGERKR